MRPEKLASMANQIAIFFHSYPDDEAVAGIHRHLEAFWTPVMVQTFRSHIDTTTHGIDPLVIQAMHHDSTAENPAEKVISPIRQGEMATDAG